MSLQRYSTRLTPYGERAVLVSLCALILLLLTGCATASRGADYCMVYEPVYTSPEDTEETRTQVDGNNAVWLELCDEGKRGS